MRDKIILYLIFLSIIFVSAEAFASTKHLKIITSKYPDALIGDDFGVLKRSDLAINSCIAEPSPFSIKASPGYPYWQCFEVKKSKLFCDGHKYSEDYRNFATLLVISSEKNNARHEYYTRRTIDYDVCQEFVRDWKKITKNEKYVCLSGPYIEQEKDTNGMSTSYWIFDKFQTKTGCIPYFKGGCSLNYQLKTGRCPFAKSKNN
jgi:hypothetical protein